jgi:hypothetical protein
MFSTGGLSTGEVKPVKQSPFRLMKKVLIAPGAKPVVSTGYTARLAGLSFIGLQGKSTDELAIG